LEKQGICNSCFQRLTGEMGIDRLLNQSSSYVLGANLLAHEVPSRVTELLQGWRAGDRRALDAVLPLVYDELRRLAHHHLRNERPDHTLQSTALVHEAYFRLVAQDFPEWESRAHFFAIAAQLMRQILVDYARRRRAGKRGAGQGTLPLEDVSQLSPGKDPGKDIDVVVLDDALKALAELDPRKAKVVELRFFGGLTFAETAEVLDVSPVTVSRDWSTARAWLHREMNRGS
jgi:RNA polymerase sigma factor (TIGR02999 family)